MRKIFFALLMVSAVLSMKAQLSFSCTHREYCAWNTRLEIFTDCQGYDENSLFVINDNETMFVHTTPTMKSSYYIQNKEYDKESNQLRYDVVSDVGNKYYYVFDLEEKEIRILIDNDDGISMLRFTVKAIF